MFEGTFWHHLVVRRNDFKKGPLPNTSSHTSQHKVIVCFERRLIMNRQNITDGGILSQTSYPGVDPCDFLSSSVTVLQRILQGNALFPWGNNEFLDKSCNGEVSGILTGFETRFISEDALLSIRFKSGSWSGGPKILHESCNGEVHSILTRF